MIVVRLSYVAAGVVVSHYDCYDVGHMSLLFTLVSLLLI